MTWTNHCRCCGVYKAREHCSGCASDGFVVAYILKLVDPWCWYGVCPCSPLASKQIEAVNKVFSSITKRSPDAWGTLARRDFVTVPVLDHKNEISFFVWLSISHTSVRKANARTPEVVGYENWRDRLSEWTIVLRYLTQVSNSRPLVIWWAILNVASVLLQTTPCLMWVLVFFCSAAEAYMCNTKLPRIRGCTRVLVRLSTAVIIWMPSYCLVYPTYMLLVQWFVVYWQGTQNSSWLLLTCSSGQSIDDCVLLCDALWYYDWLCVKSLSSSYNECVNSVS